MSHESRKAMIVPSLRYRDAPAAIEFLCEAFGFARHLVVPGSRGIHQARPTHAGRRHDHAGVGPEPRLRPARQDAPGSRRQHAERLRHRAGNRRPLWHAKAAGAEIAMDIEDMDYGGRLYSALDRECNLWHFGSYDPWAESG